LQNSPAPGTNSALRKALLLDLDGTLINLDLDRFLKRYAELLAQWFAPEVSPERFGPAFMEGVMAMMDGTGSDRVNGQRFYDRFCQRLGVDEEWARQRADRFYEEAYPTLHTMVQPIPAAPRLVEAARRHGWMVVVATQPFFPRTAIEQRLRWGGLDPQAFDYITHMDAFRASKPHPLFFQELCEAIGVPPSRCVMVGNDVHDDMLAASYGMATFLAKDFILRADHPAPPPRAAGSLDDLIELVETGELERWIS